MLTFIAGLILGGLIGCFVMALLAMASRTEHQMEQFDRDQTKATKENP